MHYVRNFFVFLRFSLFKSVHEDLPLGFSDK